MFLGIGLYKFLISYPFYSINDLKFWISVYYHIIEIIRILINSTNLIINILKWHDPYIFSIIECKIWCAHKFICEVLYSKKCRAYKISFRIHFLFVWLNIPFFYSQTCSLKICPYIQYSYIHRPFFATKKISWTCKNLSSTLLIPNTEFFLH